RAAADIVAVVSARTQLRKTGARYMGRCPFHEERTPSFSVNAPDKLYYCFGCGAKGDLITFVRETEQLDFAGAIEWLADRFNVQLLPAGLVNRRGNHYFSGRLVFPLADARGRVLGFQARKLREDDPLRAKYVNSAEGELFRKGDLLYGLDRARGAIAKQDRAVVVEGNPDVLALRQAGIEPVVASMGTALTERQLRELGRLTKHIVLCFDGDAA